MTTINDDRILDARDMAEEIAAARRTDMTSDLMKNDIELAKGITELVSVTDKAITILASAILELEDPEANHCLRIGTRDALRTLVEGSR